MFHPEDRPMERGWVGRIDGDRVVHLAAQTLQSFFTGGGSAREHAEYELAHVRLLAPILHPPSVRVFDEQSSFAFANPAAIIPTDVTIDPPGGGPLDVVPRLAAIVGQGGSIEAFTVLADWRDPSRTPPKDRDFALSLGPVATTVDELDPHACAVTVRIEGSERRSGPFANFDWNAAVALAHDGTTLFPGDLVAGPSFGAVTGLAPGMSTEIDVDGIGVLRHGVGG